RQPALAGLHHKCLIKRIPLALDVACRRSGAVAHVVRDQRAWYAELQVGLELFVIIDINLRDQSLESLLEDQKMQVRRTIIMTAGRTHEIADRTVHGYRVAGRLHASKTEMTAGVGSELSAQVHRRLLGVLLLVEALRRGVPDVDFSIGNRFSGLIFDQAIDEQSSPRRRRTHDRAAALRAW